MTTPLTRATEAVTEAIYHDSQRDYHMAYKKYKCAIGFFLPILKHERCPNTRRALSVRIDEYISRAEKLSSMVHGGSPRGADSGTISVPSPAHGTLIDRDHSSTSLVTMDDVAGLETVKSTLEECIKLPLAFPNLFVGNRKPWRGILLYGPGGTGKSMIASAIANECKSSFYSVSSSDIVSKFQGESERLIKELFRAARESAPSIIFIDEVDSMCSSRSDSDSDSNRRIKTEFLVQMQGVGKDNGGVLVIGATNIPWELDAAIRRRFEKRIYVPLPDLSGRRALLGIHSGDLYSSPATFEALARETEGYSGSDISSLVNDALFEPVRRCQRAHWFRRTPGGKWTPCESGDPGAHDMTIDSIETSELDVPRVTEEDYFTALSRSTVSVSPGDLGRYEEWTTMFGIK